MTLVLGRWFSARNCSGHDVLSLFRSGCPLSSSASRSSGEPWARRHGRVHGPSDKPTKRFRRKRPRPEDRIDTGLSFAAVGRANVGKSTLFNRLARAGALFSGDRGASVGRFPFVPSVVDSFPGVTRDARASLAAIGDLSFKLIDTAGLEDAPMYTRVGNSDSSSASVVQSPWKGKQAESESMLTFGALDPDDLYRALYEGMAEATIRAVKESDAALFVLDASEGVTPVDLALARWLRTARPHGDVILVANKSDTKNAEYGASEALELGFGEPVAISAEHNMGMADFYRAILAVHEKSQMRQARLVSESSGQMSVSLLKDRTCAETPDGVNDESSAPRPANDMREQSSVPAREEECEDEDILFDPEYVKEPPIENLIVSIVGRPNVGKSSLISRLTQSDASLIGPAAGVTRDALLCEWRPDKPEAEALWIVDTAGIRDKTRVLGTRVESQSVKSSLRALRQSHVAVIVVDANDILTAQDVRIAQIAVTEGRAIVFVINKMDCVNNQEKMDALETALSWQVRESLNQVSGVEIVRMSALDWSNGAAQADLLYEAVQRARHRWEKRVPTSALTRFVTRFNETIAVGMKGAKRGRRGTTKFISQKKIRPPMFRLDGSSAVSDTYVRALTNAIRAEFGFEGVPIRIKRPSRRQRK